MARILIVERINSIVYVYTESLRHHAGVQGNLTAMDGARLVSNYVEFDVFDSNCDAMEALQDDQWTSTVIV
jgi:hypothetical protein